MSTSISYPAGVPCWVDTFQPDPAAAAQFYGLLLRALREYLHAPASQ